MDRYLPLVLRKEKKNVGYCRYHLTSARVSVRRPRRKWVRDTVLFVLRKHSQSSPNPYTASCWVDTVQYTHTMKMGKAPLKKQGENEIVFTFLASLLAGWAPVVFLCCVLLQPYVALNKVLNYVKESDASLGLVGGECFAHIQPILQMDCDATVFLALCECPLNGTSATERIAGIYFNLLACAPSPSGS